MDLVRNSKYYIHIAILLLFVSTLFWGCKFKKGETGWQYSVELRPSLISKDSTTVTLKIEFLRGCTELEGTQIRATIEGSQMKVVSQRLTTDKGQRFFVSKDSFFNALSLFEKACVEKKGCGGYGGGTGVSIEKHFNGKVSHFNYCQEYGQDEGWNGIEHLFWLMGRKLEDYPFK